MSDLAMPSGNDTPQVLLEHHLKQLRLPTFLREYDKVARYDGVFDRVLQFANIARPAVLHQQ
jgi:hypothetical protein